MPTKRSPRRGPRRAIVFAAGFGERMQPVSAVRPKPLLTLWGRTALLLVLERLRTWGVEEALINLHYGADAIWRTACTGAPAGLRLAFSFEPTLLGTGGALRRASWFIGDDPFWLCNADVIGAPDPATLSRAFRQHDAIAAVWLHPARGPRTVEARRGQVVSFHSARPGAPGTYTFCGTQLVSPRLLEFLPDQPERFGTIIEAYERARAAGAVVAAVVSDAWWADVGTPEDYLAAHRETRAGAHAGRPEGAFYDPASERRARRLAARAGATVWGFVNAEGGARLGRGARLEDVVLLAGAGVAAHADVRRAIVAGGAVARGTARRAVGPAGPALTPAEHAALRGLGWRVESVTIEALSPRGSGRSFWRLAGPHRRAMLVRYGADRTENARYTGHARFLRRLGLPVPRVLAEHTEKRFAILEDLGDRTLAEAVRGTTATTFLRRYAEVVDLVARWHGERVASAARREKLALEPPFGPSVYRYERELFLHDFLAERLSVSDAELRNVDRDLRSVAHCLTAAPPVLLHRDLQSSNILLRRGRAHFIDFQGMRFGPAMYDVASLLCDPYVEFPAGVPERLLARYLRRREGSAGEADFFWPAAVERLAQALGAFARLAALPGGGHFAEFIPLAVKRLRDAVERCDLPLPALRVLMATIEKRTPRRIGRRDRGFRSPSMPPAFSRREA